MTPDGERVFVDVEGTRIGLTSLDKVMYPMTGTTKAEVLQYYTLIKGPLLEQLAGRPVTRKRWPHGTGDLSFFEKNASSGTPRWVRRAPVENPESQRHTMIDWPLIDSLPALVWHANLNSLELHTPQWTVTADGSPQNPDRLVIDLDPGPGTGLAECARVALWVRERLRDQGLDPWPVTSGSKGMQLYAAVEPDGGPGEESSDEVRDRVRALAEALAKEHSKQVTAVMARSRRPGKVFLDWSQNSGSKTTITPWSLRGKDEPTVACPREWDEVEAGADGSEELTQLRYEDVLDRLGLR